MKRDGRANKTVFYWLAKLLNSEAKILLSHEHQNFKWMNLEEVKNEPEGMHKETIDMIEEAEYFLILHE